MSVALSPAQERALGSLVGGLQSTSVAALWCPTGMGRTTVLRELHARLGSGGGGSARMLGVADLLAASAGGHPLALEDALYTTLARELDAADAVVLDDLHLLTDVVSGGCHAYPRNGWIAGPLTALCTRAVETGKRLVFGHDSRPPGPVNERCHYAAIEEFKPEDYAALCRTFWDANEAADAGTATAEVDFAKVHRFAPKLNAHQLRAACTFVTPAGRMDTERFIDYLRSRRMASNVDLEEVQAVDLRDLKGVDDVVRALEANVIVPLENDALAAELDLRPKRGVLLAGPPGTGKTTVGRALAHRLKGKFFLIDGTFISGTSRFYQMVHQVFAAAKQNAPAVIFIDDSDVIFENGQEAGLYRYLLTMLDGLESASSGRVCVMMTAMNVGALPPALIRSGRIELWLETRLPDEGGRAEILRAGAAKLPPAMGSADVGRLAAESEGLTGADLKRLLDDGKILYAYDRAHGRPTRDATAYFLEAVEAVRANKQRYAAAEAQARAQRPVRPPWYDVFPSFVGDDGPDGEP